MDGVKVVELGVWVAGPAAGGILSDWGADVVKIEPPSGDPSRTFQQMLGGDMPTNPVFELDNRSKRSVVVDLAQPEGQAIAAEIIDEADVFLTNLRLSALDRLGLDYESLAARNPALVYCAITGYGLEGPDADRPAYDIAASGPARASLPSSPRPTAPCPSSGAGWVTTTWVWPERRPSARHCSTGSAPAKARWCPHRCSGRACTPSASTSTSC